MKKLLRVLFLTVVLCLVTAFGVSAKGSVTKLEKTVKPTGGTGSDITITTANKFLVEDYCFMFQFKGNENFLRDAMCNVKIGNNESNVGIYYENGVYYTQVDMWNFNISSSGIQTVNLELSDYYSDLKYSTSFQINFVDDLGTLGILDGLASEERIEVSKYANGINVGIYSVNDFWPENVVLVNKNGVKYMGMDPQNYNDFNYGQIENVLYSDIFDANLLNRFSRIDGYHFFPWLEQGRPLEPGMYDLWVYDEEGTNYAVLKDVVEVVDMPEVEVYDNDEYLEEAKPGDKKFSIGVALKGIDIDDITVKLYDNNKNLFATSTGRNILTNNYQENQYMVEMEAVNGFEYGSYNVEVVANCDVMVDGRVYFSNNNSGTPYINGYVSCEDAKANYIMKLRNPNPTHQYKFELYDPSGKMIAETYTYASEEGYVDLEFLDNAGNVINIEPTKQYRIVFYYKQDGAWKQASKVSVSMRYSYTSSSSSSGGAATSLSGYANIYDGGVEGSLTMPQSMAYQYSIDSAFELRVLSITGEIKRYTPKCTRRTLNNGSYYIWLENPGLDLPAGYYKVAIYYNSKPVVDFEDYFNFTQPYYVGSYYDGIKNTRYIRRFYNDSANAKAPVLKLYSVLDGDYEPEYEGTLVKNGNEYVIPDSADFDKNQKYFYELKAGEEAETEFYTGYYFSTQTAPNPSQKCTVTVKQTANGTTSVSNTNPNVGDIVYVYAKADEGYMYSPVSVKVNGIRIKGRSFTVFENATVEVEYTEIPTAMYMISTDDHNSSYVSSSVDKKYYKAGETVKVNIKINGDRYKLGELYYIKSGDNYNQKVDIDKTTMSFVMPDSDITITAGYDWKSEYSVNQEQYNEYYICVNGSMYGSSYIMEGESVTVLPYLKSTRRELPASEFEELYYVLSSDSTGKKHTIYGGKFTMPSENIKIYGKLRKRPITEEVTGKGSVKFFKGNQEVTEAYATEMIYVEGNGVGTFSLTSIEVNGAQQTSRSFEMPAGTLKLKANFTSYSYCKVDVLPCENGELIVELPTYEDGVDDYETIKITVNPDECYRLKALYINEDDYSRGVENNKYDLRISKDTVISAEFEKYAYKVSYVDYNNNIIATKLYNIGDEGVYEGATPYRAPDENYAYIFTGWDKESVADSATVYAQYKAVPYTKIENEEQLKTMSGDGYYLLMNDITLSGKWTPIEEFSGVLDGNGHKISNIDSEIVSENGLISGSVMHFSGFFKSLKGIVVNTGFELNCTSEINETGTLEAGGIAAVTSGALIENCYVKGSMNYLSADMSFVGALASSASNSVIRNCYTEAEVSAQSEYSYVAGMVYSANSTNAYTSYSNCAVNHGTDGKSYVFFGEFGDGYHCYYNSEKANGADSRGAYGLTTVKFKSLASYTYSNKCYWDFAKVWNLDSAVNGGLPALKTFEGKQSVEATGESRYSNKVVEATIKFSAPVTGMTFVKAYSENGKVLTSKKIVPIQDTYNSLDVKVKVNEKPEKLKVFVWENFANIKPVVMETLDVE